MSPHTPLAYPHTPHISRIYLITVVGVRVRGGGGLGSVWGMRGMLGVRAGCEGHARDVSR